MEAGTARSVFWNGLPLIAFISPNVNRMTTRMMGIVQITRLITSLVMRAASRARFGTGGGRWARPRQFDYEVMETFVRSTLFIGLNAYPWTVSVCRFVYVYQ